MSTQNFFKYSTVVLLILSSLCSLIEAQQLNTTSYADDYVIQNKRQYAANIQNYETQLAAFKVNYVQQLNTIDVQTVLVETKLLEVQQKLNPLELLEGLTKHCVQKYRSQITTIAIVKSALSNCVLGAQNNMNSFVSAADTTMRNLNSYYNNQLNTALNECSKKHSPRTLNYTLCVTQVISTTNSVTVSNQKTFATQLEQAQCSGEARIKLALDCSFTALYDVIGKVGETMRLIDNCIAGLEYCPPCENTTQWACENLIDLKLDEADFRNATITNPFYGMNSNATCLQINIY